MVQGNETTRLYEQILRNWILSNRREALILGGSAIAYLLSAFEQAIADAEFQIQVTGQDPARSKDISSKQAKIHDREFGNQIGIEYRAPTCGMQELTAIQLFATGTPADAPDYLSAPPGSYFANNFARSFIRNEETCLSTAPNTIGGGGTSHDKNYTSPLEPALPHGETIAADFWQLMYDRASSLSALAKGAIDSVDWSTLIDAAVGQSMDKAVEEVAKFLTGVPAASAAAITNAIGIVELIFESPEARDGPEWLLSPAERRELLSKPGLGLGHVPEPLPQGPELRNTP
jgi:hypothetical protein